MKPNIIIYLLAILLCSCESQNYVDEISALEGIWIAENYFESFEENLSAIESKKSFSKDYPVALRINSKDLEDEVLKVGYSILHDHMLHPEVSEYIIFENDTIREQGNFTVNLSKAQNSSHYKTSEIYYFNYNCESFLTWSLDDTIIALYRPKNNKCNEIKINYKRIETKLGTDYQFPNPLYYYTRTKTLSGDYILKDKNGNLLSDNFSIGKNGIIKGYPKLENFTTYFSTDIYCGSLPKNDFILVYDNILHKKSSGFRFEYIRTDSGNIMLYKKVNHLDSLQLEYELIRN